jgi:hypothetical protein
VASTISRRVTLSFLALLIGALWCGAAAPASLSSLIASADLKRHIIKPPSGILRHEYIVPCPSSNPGPHSSRL